jgi:ribosomal protein S14
MLKKKKKDILNRFSYCHNEVYKQTDKFIIKNLLSKFHFNKNKTFIVSSSNKLLKLFKFNKIKINRKCVLSNRNRANIRSYNFSQRQFKELSDLNFIAGSQKSSW